MRRALELAILSTVLAACGAAPINEESDEEMAAVPWHMWGSTELVSQEALTPGLQLNKTVQLTQIEYKRPIAWRFFFAAKLLRYVNSSPAPVDVFFDASFGSGRSTVLIPAFEHFQFATGATGADAVKYSATVLGPPRIQATADTNIIEKLVAQNVQIQARVRMQATIVGDGCDVEVHSYFAPDDHIRPEWFQGKFPGGEDTGR